MIPTVKELRDNLGLTGTQDVYSVNNFIWASKNHMIHEEPFGAAHKLQDEDVLPEFFVIMDWLSPSEDESLFYRALTAPTNAVVLHTWDSSGNMLYVRDAQAHIVAAYKQKKVGAAAIVKMAASPETANLFACPRSVKESGNPVVLGNIVQLQNTLKEALRAPQDPETTWGSILAPHEVDQLNTTLSQLIV